MLTNSFRIQESDQRNLKKLWPHDVTRDIDYFVYSRCVEAQKKYGKTTLASFGAVGAEFPEILFVIDAMG